MTGNSTNDPSTTPTENPGDGTPSSTVRPDSLKNLGPYEIIGEVGRGGMGVVFKARHPQLKRTVALKVLIAGEDASEEAIERFHREAEAVAKLGHHPNIVPVYDIGAKGNLHWFAMHFVEGKPLDKAIDGGHFAPERAAEITRKIAMGLHHAHRNGILHRDIKPANILLASPGEVSSVECRVSGKEPERRHSTPDTEHSPDMDIEPLITDFGLAKDVESGSKVTRSGVMLGTPHYMAPEQFEAENKAIDERSDVYALGATLYEMLTLRPPFEGDTPAVIVKKGILEDPVTPRKYNPGVDEKLATICLKCLRKNPAKRYQSAEELAMDLERFLQGKPVEARPPTTAGKAARPPGREKTLLAVLVCVILLLGAYIVMDRLSRGGTEGDPSTPPTAPETVAPKTKKGKEAKVVWIVDGDTIHAVLDGRKEKIRLLNINAPEQKQPFCKASGKHLRKLISGKTVLLLPESTGADFTRGDHGRLLAFVFIGEKNVNVEMVRAGMARFFTKFSRGRFGDDLEKAEKEAKAGKLGIWSVR